MSNVQAMIDHPECYNADDVRDLACEVKALNDRVIELASQRDKALAACKAAVACCGGSQHWSGETKAFLELCEAVVSSVCGDYPASELAGVK